MGAPAGIQSTFVYLVAILALTMLAGVAILSNHDPSGNVLSNVLTAIGVLAGAAAGAHASNGAKQQAQEDRSETARDKRLAEGAS